MYKCITNASFKLLWKREVINEVKPSRGVHKETPSTLASLFFVGIHLYT